MLGNVLVWEAMPSPLNLDIQRCLVTNNDLQILYESAGESHELTLLERDTHALFFDDVHPGRWSQICGTRMGCGLRV